MATKIIDSTPREYASELDFVDPDIRAMFDHPDMSFFTGQPTILQLSRDIRTLNILLKELIDEFRTNRLS